MHYRPSISWRSLPLLRLLIPFYTGIVMAFYFGGIGKVFTLLLIISTAAFLIAHFASRKWFGIRLLATIFGYATMFFMGALLQTMHFPKQADVSTELKVRASVLEVTKGRSAYRALLRVNGTVPEKDLSREKLLAYIYDSAHATALLPGDIVWLKGTLQPISPPPNPGMFDFRNYMLHKGVKYSVRIRDGALVKTSSTDSRLIVKRVSLIINTRLQEVLFKYLKDPNDRAIIAGILLGSRTQLDDTIIDQFRDTGIMHILSVSGMHVAILYGLLMLLLKWVPETDRKKQVGKQLLIILIIWAFAFITGLSPAVQRAAFMFTLIVFGKLANRHAETINLVAGSALILLMFDPGLLFNAGFQLSYAAVSGIVLLYKPVYNFFHFKNYAADLTWKTCVVSIAAQLFTAPLCWYYFGEFPLYFLLGNLIAVPLSSIIMWLGMLLAAVYAVPFIAKLTASLLHGSIWLLLKGTGLVSALPYANISEGNITIWAVAVLFFMLLGIYHFVTTGRVKSLYASAILLIICCTLLYADRWKSSNTSAVYLWQIPRHSAIVAQNGRNLHIWTDSALIASKKDFEYQFGGFIREQSCKRVNVTDIRNFSGNVLISNGKRLGFYDEKKMLCTPTMNVDAVLIMNSPYLDTARLFSTYDPEKVVMDGSNSKYRLKIYSKLLGDKLVQTTSALSL